MENGHVPTFWLVLQLQKKRVLAGLEHVDYGRILVVSTQALRDLQPDGFSDGESCCARCQAEDASRHHDHGNHLINASGCPLGAAAGITQNLYLIYLGKLIIMIPKSE